MVATCGFSCLQTNNAIKSLFRITVGEVTAIVAFTESTREYLPKGSTFTFEKITTSMKSNEY